VGRSLTGPLEGEPGTDGAGDAVRMEKRYELGQEELLGAHVEAEGFA
jgi:hypothetical protein